MNLNGKPAVSRFKYTKASAELNDIVSDWAKVRANVGQKDLLRLEGDNAAGDSAQQHSASPSLLRDVIPYQEETSLPRYIVSADDYSYVSTPPGCDTFANTALAFVLNPGTTSPRLRNG